MHVSWIKLYVMLGLLKPILAFQWVQASLFIDSGTLYSKATCRRFMTQLYKCSLIMPFIMSECRTPVQCCVSVTLSVLTGSHYDDRDENVLGRRSAACQEFGWITKHIRQTVSHIQML